MEKIESYRPVYDVPETEQLTKSDIIGIVGSGMIALPAVAAFIWVLLHFA
jgi:hypothetical protein